MILSYKNIPININGQQIFVNNASLNFDINIEPKFLIGEKYSKNFKSINSFPTNSLDLNYYLIHNDPIKNLIFNDGPTEIRFGNLLIKSGYLSNFSLSSDGMGPISANSNFLFWEYPENKIEPIEVTNNQVGGRNTFIHAADIYFSENSENWPANPADILIRSLNYSYTNNFIADGHVSNFGDNRGIFPSRIFSQSTNATLNLNAKFNSFENISLTGENIYAKIHLRDATKNDVPDFIYINGNITSKSINISSKESIETNIEIKQNIFNTFPEIIYVNNLNPTPLTNLVLELNNDYNINSINLNGENIPFSYGNKMISLMLPNSAFSGNLNIDTEVGTVSTGLKIIPNEINITSLSSNFGSSGQTISIAGTNFYDITGIRFGSQYSRFYEVINNKLIYVEIPPKASYDYVYLFSHRQITGRSPNKFISLPIISKFNPSKADSGDTIEISGYNFNSVTGLLFNSNYASFSLVSDEKINATVPEGNIYGKIELHSYGHIKTYSNSVFKPNVRITGFKPLSVVEGDVLSISGKNFVSDYLYPKKENASLFHVYFHKNKIGYFGRESDILLTGIVPSDIIDGPIGIFDKDGSSLYGTGYMDKGISVPEPASLNNTIAYSGQKFYTVFEGQELQDVSGVWLSAVSVPNNANLKHIITSDYLFKDPDGDKLHLVGYKFLGDNITGTYNVSAVSPVDKIGNLPTRYRVTLLSGALF